MPKLSLQDLNRELRDWGNRYPRLAQDAIFVTWFLREYVTEEERDAVDALTGRSSDKGVDAVLIDDRIKAVFIVQGKFRRTLMSNGEKREDVLALAQLAHTIYGDDDDWETYSTKLAADTRRRLGEARERLLERAG